MKLPEGYDLRQAYNDIMALAIIFNEDRDKNKSNLDSLKWAVTSSAKEADQRISWANNRINNIFLNKKNTSYIYSTIIEEGTDKEITLDKE